MVAIEIVQGPITSSAFSRLGPQEFHLDILSLTEMCRFD